MATLADQLVGTILIFLGIAIWTYYTLWTIVTPFLPDDHQIQQYFPDRKLGLIIPGVAGVLLLTAIGVFVGRVLAAKAAKSKAKKSS